MTVIQGMATMPAFVSNVTSFAESVHVILVAHTGKGEGIERRATGQLCGGEVGASLLVGHFL